MMVAKKKAAVRGPARGEATAVDQPAAERRAAEALLAELVAAHAPGHAKPISAIRKALRKRLPAAHEIVYAYNGFFVISYSPSVRGYEGLFGIRGDAAGVRFYLTRAKELPDPAKLLRSSGGQARWIDLESPAALKRPEVAAMIDAAIALNTVPFAREGRSSIVISPSTKKRRQA